MYWDIGKYISQKVETEKWDKSVVEQLSEYILQNEPNIRGFNARNIWRMKQFYETYKGNEKLSTLWSEISWSHNRLIMTLKTPEEREFYLKICSKQNYSVRKLERLISSGTFERTMLANEKRSDIVKNLPQETENVFKDSYIFEFLILPTPHSTKNLQQTLVSSLKDFILECGNGFSFVGQEYRLQVGNEDFFIDLLFFNRNLKCLVAFELKITKLKPEHLGQLEFYLKA